MNTCVVCNESFGGDLCTLCGTAAASALEPRRVGLPARPAERTRAVARPLDPRKATMLEGNLVDARGPIHEAPRWNPWKTGTKLLLFLALAPVVFGLWLVFFSLGVGLSMAGLRRERVRSGLFDEILFHHTLGLLFRRADPVPVYHLVLACPQGQVLVRQEGDFLDGQVFRGNRLRLHGRMWRGSFLARGGTNLSLGARLSLRGNRWPAGFVAAALVLTAEVAFVLSFAH